MGCAAARGLLLIHDFMLDDNETGPALAALWFLQYLSGRIDGISFSAATLTAQVLDQGFDRVSDQVVIRRSPNLSFAQNRASDRC